MGVTDSAGTWVQPDEADFRLCRCYGHFNNGHCSGVWTSDPLLPPWQLPVITYGLSNGWQQLL